MDNIYHFESYEEFLRFEVEKFLARGSSWRELSANCGFKSPNYLQLIAFGKRGLPLKTVAKVAIGLELDSEKVKFLKLLINSNSRSKKIAAKASEELSQLRAGSNHQEISDYSLYDRWYHSVIYELTSFGDFDADPEKISRRLRGMVSAKEVEGSLEFLLSKGWVIKNDRGDYCQKPIQFSGGNSKGRSIAMREMHAHFLKMAIHRLNDELGDRSYQALTISIPWKKFEVVHNRMRQFIDDLDAELTSEDENDAMIRVQCCAFKISI